MMHKDKIQKLKAIYEQGGNIIRYLKDMENREKNTIDDILISYDLQAGSDSKWYKEHEEWKDRYLTRFTDIIDGFDCPKNSILECGCGEATTIAPLMRKVKTSSLQWYGIDISWSRLKAGQLLANEVLKDFEVKPNLAVGDMFDLPFADNSVDIVYSSMSMEPNGGNEKAILQELYRVASEYLLLIEPAYEFADAEAKKRMEEHGYVRDLYGIVKKLGYEVVTWELYGISTNPLNPEGLMIIKKKRCESKSVEPTWYCPISKKPLEKIGDTYFSKESYLAYPIVNGVPVLLSDYSIIATKMNDFIK